MFCIETHKHYLSHTAWHSITELIATAVSYWQFCQKSVSMAVLATSSCTAGNQWWDISHRSRLRHIKHDFHLSNGYFTTSSSTQDPWTKNVLQSFLFTIKSAERTVCIRWVVRNVHNPFSVARLFMKLYSKTKQNTKRRAQNWVQEIHCFLLFAQNNEFKEK